MRSVDHAQQAAISPALFTAATAEGTRMRIPDAPRLRTGRNRRQAGIGPLPGMDLAAATSKRIVKLPPGATEPRPNDALRAGLQLRARPQTAHPGRPAPGRNPPAIAGSRGDGAADEFRPG
jgi:hypothetical protein